jgi:hypothetical protein
MSAIIHGVGYRLLGQRDFRPDRSYLTTEFFCVLYLPLYPTRTIRVIPDKKNSRLPFGRSKFVLLEKLPRPELSQVISVYIYAVLIVLFGFGFFLFIEPYLRVQDSFLSDEWVEPFLFGLWLMLPVMIVSKRRNNARQRVLEENRNPNDPAPIG